MAVSVVCERDKDAAAKLPGLSEILKPICPDLDCTVIDNTGFLDIRNCEVLETFYTKCMVATACPRPQFSDLPLKFYLALAEGRDDTEAKLSAQRLLTAIERDMMRISEGVALYITHVVYEQLPPKYRDNYHSSVELSIKAHRRFSEEGLDCFVVSPIGNEDTTIRERADLVFERYIKPACEAANYRARRSDHIISPTIDDEILKKLEESQMVAVYLGSLRDGGWNANVMWEFGFRVKSKKPLILLKDKPVDGSTYSLPFDIRNHRCIDIPEDEPKSMDDVIRTICDFIIELGRGQAEMTFPYPSATLEVAGGKAIITEKMGDLEQLFNMPHVLRKDLQSEILPHLYDYMPSKQVYAFEEEQSKLVGKIMVGTYKNVHATVPMFFSKHPTFHNRAFLPVIVSYSSVANSLRLNVIYVEVTGALTKHDDGHVCCDLVGQRLAQPPAAGENVIPMKASGP